MLLSRFWRICRLFFINVKLLIFLSCFPFFIGHLSFFIIPYNIFRRLLFVVFYLLIRNIIWRVSEPKTNKRRQGYLRFFQFRTFHVSKTKRYFQIRCLQTRNYKGTGPLCICVCICLAAYFLSTSYLSWRQTQARRAILSPLHTLKQALSVSLSLLVLAPLAFSFAFAARPACLCVACLFIVSCSCSFLPGLYHVRVLVLVYVLNVKQAPERGEHNTRISTDRREE